MSDDPDPVTYAGRWASEQYERGLQRALGRYYAPECRIYIPLLGLGYALSIGTATAAMVLFTIAATAGWAALLVHRERRWSDTEGSA